MGTTISVFASLCDPLDNAVPIEWFVDYLDALRATPHLTHLLLTKRIGAWRRRLQAAADVPGSSSLLDWMDRWIGGDPPPNVWIGATVVNQDEADRDVPKLLSVSARVRFLSVEPMLEGIWIQKWLRPSCNLHGGPVAADGLCDVCIGRGLWSLPAHQRPSADARLLPGIDWVISGGESGPHARPMHPDWVRSLRDQCAAAGVPFHHKQNGEWEHVDTVEDSRSLPSTLLRYFPDLDETFYRRGRKAAGRQLDGRTHDEFPV